MTTQAQIEAVLKEWNATHQKLHLGDIKQIAALSAAAEAGESCGCGYDNPDDVCMVHEPIIKRHVAATIERCAQVAENVDPNKPANRFEIAAEIRALKDQP